MTTEVINDEVTNSSTFYNASSGIGRGYGSAGQLAAGILPSGETFSLPLPLQAVSTVNLRLRTAKEGTIRGLEDRPMTLKALRFALKRLDLGPLEVVVKPRTMINYDKDLGLKEADASATVKALYDALELPLLNKDLVALVEEATSLPMGFSGSPYAQMTVLDFKGQPLKSLPNLPRLAYTVIRPTKNSKRQELQADAKSEKLLKEVLALTSEEVTPEQIGLIANTFTEISLTQSPHELDDFLRSDLKPHFVSKGLLAPVGVSVSLTGHGAVVLFDASLEGRRAASAASIFLREVVGPNYWVDASTSHGPGKVN